MVADLGISSYRPGRFETCSETIFNHQLIAVLGIFMEYFNRDPLTLPDAEADAERCEE